MVDNGSGVDASAEPVRDESVVWFVARLALLWGGLYLSWRAIMTLKGTEPVVFPLLYACELFGWAMLVFLCYRAWRGPKSGRPVIGGPHTVDEAAGTVDNVTVRFLDLTPDGAGLVSPHAIEPGRTVDLVAELPQLDESTRTTRLRLTVTTCHPDPEPSVGWRIGGTVGPREVADREALLEYCHVVAARNRLSGTGRLRSAGPPHRQASELGFEELWLAVAAADG
jgi:hypothetical protein